MTCWASPTADHAESSPHAPHLAVTPLVCSLAGQELEVRLVHGTRAAEAYDRPTTVESYSCSYGLNPDYLEPLVDAGLVVSGRDDEDQVRIVELPRLRFFVATLFVPQLSSTPGAPHPLVRGLRGGRRRGRLRSVLGGRHLHPPCSITD